MAFLNSLSIKLQEKVKTQLPQVIEQANKAKQNLAPVISKCSQQFDNLGKILQVNVDRKQSPIDILPYITAFDPSLESTVFKINYEENCPMTVLNLGSCIAIKFTNENNSNNFEVSFLPTEQYSLEYIDFHWGTEPMNGSEHTVGGVGYAGEIHFVHRNIKYPKLDLASKANNGILALAVFLNESHDDNSNLIPLTSVFSNILYKGMETNLNSFSFSQLIPSNEKSKEFWVYDGSETIEPYRENVKWIIFRSAIPISSAQLKQFGELRKSRAEDEVEERIVSIRPLQSLNSRICRSSFKSVAQAELPLS